MQLELTEQEYDPVQHPKIPLYSGLGYAQLVDAHGSDERVIEAARMSTDSGFRGWEATVDGPGDSKLLSYLWRFGHHSPFEMAHMVFEVQAPIFVARQVFRHRLFSFNELSARYTYLSDTAWMPEPGDVRVQNETGNRQGSTPTTNAATEAYFRRQVAESYRASFATYERLCADGFAREQARTVVPLGVMTRWRQGGNLRCWLDFLKKRTPKNAQPETRQLADAVADVVRVRHPRTFALFAGEP